MMLINGQSEYINKKGRIISPIRHQAALDVLKNITRQKQNSISFQEYDDQPLFQQMEKRNNVFKAQMQPSNYTDISKQKTYFNITKDASGDIFIQKNYSKFPRRNQSVVDSYNGMYEPQDNQVITRRNQSINQSQQKQQNGHISLILKNGSVSHDNALQKYIQTEKTEYDSPTQSGQFKFQEQSDILDQITLTKGNSNNTENARSGNKFVNNNTVPLHNIFDKPIQKNEYENVRNGNQQNKNYFADSIRSIYQCNSVMSNDFSAYNEPINLMNYDLSKLDNTKQNTNQSNYLGLVSTEESSYIASPTKSNGKQKQINNIKQRSSTLDHVNYLDSLQKYQQHYLNPVEQLPNINISPDNINIKSPNKNQFQESQNEQINTQNQTLNFASPVKKSIQLKRYQIDQDKEELAKLYDQYLNNAKTNEEQAKINKNKGGNYFVTSLKGKSFNINIVSEIPKNLNCPTIEQELKTKVFLQNREKSTSPQRQPVLHTDRWK